MAEILSWLKTHTVHNIVTRRMASPSAVVLLVATLVFTSGAIAATDLNFFYYVLSVCTSSIFLSAYMRAKP